MSVSEAIELTYKPTKKKKIMERERDWGWVQERYASLAQNRNDDISCGTADAQ